MQKINKDYTEEIEQIAEILNLGTPKLIGQDYVMLCPFHEETDGSWYVNREGYHYCHGAECHVGKKMHLNTLVDNLRGNIVQEEIQNIKVHKVRTYIDGTSYKEKPSDEDFKNIVSKIETDYIKNYSIYDLAYYIVNGHTIAPAGIRSQKEWKEQQVVMLDFDNKGDINFAREEVLDYAKKIKLEPTLAYYTFRHLQGEEQKNKFRLVYCFTEPITDKRKMQYIIKYLHSRFKQFKPDPECTNLDRKFLGTNNQDIWSSDYLYKPSDRYTEEQLDAVEQIIAPYKKQYQKSKNIKGITSITAKELLSKELPQPTVIVDKLLYQGFSILGGAPKVRKKLVMLRPMSISS